MTCRIQDAQRKMINVAVQNEAYALISEALENAVHRPDEIPLRIKLFAATQANLDPGDPAVKAELDVAVRDTFSKVADRLAADLGGSLDKGQLVPLRNFLRAVEMQMEAEVRTAPRQEVAEAEATDESSADGELGALVDTRYREFVQALDDVSLRKVLIGHFEDPFQKFGSMFFGDNVAVQDLFLARIKKDLVKLLFLDLSNDNIMPDNSDVHGRVLNWLMQKRRSADNYNSAERLGGNLEAAFATMDMTKDSERALLQEYFDHLIANHFDMFASAYTDIGQLLVKKNGRYVLSPKLDLSSNFMEESSVLSFFDNFNRIAKVIIETIPVKPVTGDRAGRTIRYNNLISAFSKVKSAGKSRTLRLTGTETVHEMAVKLRGALNLDNMSGEEKLVMRSFYNWFFSERPETWTDLDGEPVISLFARYNEKLERLAQLPEGADPSALIRDVQAIEEIYGMVISEFTTLLERRTVDLSGDALEVVIDSTSRSGTGSIVAETVARNMSRTAPDALGVTGLVVNDAGITVSLAGGAKLTSAELDTLPEGDARLGPYEEFIFGTTGFNLRPDSDLRRNISFRDFKNVFNAAAAFYKLQHKGTSAMGTGVPERGNLVKVSGISDALAAAAVNAAQKNAFVFLENYLAPFDPVISALDNFYQIDRKVVRYNVEGMQEGRMAQRSTALGFHLINERALQDMGRGGLPSMFATDRGFLKDVLVAGGVDMVDTVSKHVRMEVPEYSSMYINHLFLKQVREGKDPVFAPVAYSDKSTEVLLQTGQGLVYEGRAFNFRISGTGAVPVKDATGDLYGAHYLTVGRRYQAIAEKILDDFRRVPAFEKAGDLAELDVVMAGLEIPEGVHRLDHMIDLMRGAGVAPVKNYHLDSDGRIPPALFGKLALYGDPEQYRAEMAGHFSTFKQLLAEQGFRFDDPVLEKEGMEGGTAGPLLEYYFAYHNLVAENFILETQGPLFTFGKTHIPGMPYIQLTKRNGVLVSSNRAFFLRGSRTSSPEKRVFVNKEVDYIDRSSTVNGDSGYVMDDGAEIVNEMSMIQRHNSLAGYDAGFHLKEVGHTVDNVHGLARIEKKNSFNTINSANMRMSRGTRRDYRKLFRKMLSVVGFSYQVPRADAEAFGTLAYEDGKVVEKRIPWQDGEGNPLTYTSFLQLWDALGGENTVVKGTRNNHDIKIGEGRDALYYRYTTIEDTVNHPAWILTELQSRDFIRKLAQYRNNSDPFGAALANSIKGRYVEAVLPESALKQGATLPRKYKVKGYDLIENPDDLTLQDVDTFPIEGIGVQLKTGKDTEDAKVTHSTQLLGVSVFGTQQMGLAAELYRVSAMIAEEGISKHRAIVESGSRKNIVDATRKVLRNALLTATDTDTAVLNIMRLANIPFDNSQVYGALVANLNAAFTSKSIRRKNSGMQYVIAPSIEVVDIPVITDGQLEVRNGRVVTRPVTMDRFTEQAGRLAIGDRPMFRTVEMDGRRYFTRALMPGERLVKEQAYLVNGALHRPETMGEVLELEKATGTIEAVHDSRQLRMHRVYIGLVKKAPDGSVLEERTVQINDFAAVKNIRATSDKAEKARIEHRHYKRITEGLAAGGYTFDASDPDNGVPGLEGGWTVDSVDFRPAEAIGNPPSLHKSGLNRQVQPSDVGPGTFMDIVTSPRFAPVLLKALQGTGDGLYQRLAGTASAMGLPSNVDLLEAADVPADIIAEEVELEASRGAAEHSPAWIMLRALMGASDKGHARARITGEKSEGMVARAQERYQSNLYKTAKRRVELATLYGTAEQLADARANLENIMAGNVPDLGPAFEEAELTALAISSRSDFRQVLSDVQKRAAMDKFRAWQESNRAYTVRIPASSLNYASSLEIVAYLPGQRDTLMVSPELEIRQGSDKDVDKANVSFFHTDAQGMVIGWHPGFDPSDRSTWGAPPDGSGMEGLENYRNHLYLKLLTSVSSLPELDVYTNTDTIAELAGRSETFSGLFSENQPMSAILNKYENLSAKAAVGIVATGIKAYSAMLVSYGKYVREMIAHIGDPGLERPLQRGYVAGFDLDRVLLDEGIGPGHPKRGEVLAALLEKDLYREARQGGAQAPGGPTKELLEGFMETLVTRPKPQRMLDELLQAAVDNAKLLYLNKINGGIKSLTYYVAGIANGYSMEELFRVMDSPAARMVTGLSGTDIFDRSRSGHRWPDEIAGVLNILNDPVEDYLNKNPFLKEEVKESLQGLRAALIARGPASEQEMLVALDREIEEKGHKAGRTIRDIYARALASYRKMLGTRKGLAGLPHNDRVKQDIRDLLRLKEESREFRVLAQSLGLNQGIPATGLDMLNFARRLEGLLGPGGRLDMDAFAFQENERQKVAAVYENLKLRINPFLVFSDNPHYVAYLQTFQTASGYNNKLTYKSLAIELLRKFGKHYLVKEREFEERHVKAAERLLDRIFTNIVFRGLSIELDGKAFQLEEAVHREELVKSLDSAIGRMATSDRYRNNLFIRALARDTELEPVTARKRRIWRLLIDPNQMTGDRQKIYRPALEKALRETLYHNTVPGSLTDYELLRLYTWLKHGDGRSKNSFARYFSSNDRISGLLYGRQADPADIGFMRDVISGLDKWPVSTRDVALLLGFASSPGRDHEDRQVRKPDRWEILYHENQRYLHYNDIFITSVPEQVGLDAGMVTLPLRAMDEGTAKKVVARYAKEGESASIDGFLVTEQRVQDMLGELGSPAFRKAMEELDLDVSSFDQNNFQLLERVHGLVRDYLRNLFYLNRGAETLGELAMKYFGTKKADGLPGYVTRAINSARWYAEGQITPPGGWQPVRAPFGTGGLRRAGLSERTEVPETRLSEGDVVGIGDLITEMERMGFTMAEIMEVLRSQSLSEEEIGEHLKKYCKK